MKDARSLLQTMAHLREHRVAAMASRGDGVENGSYAIAASRRRPRDTASIPREPGFLASNTHPYASPQRHVVLDERFDTPLADRPLPIQELDDLAVALFRREVDGAFLIFVDRVEARLRGCDGISSRYSQTPRLPLNEAKCRGVWP